MEYFFQANAAPALHRYQLIPGIQLVTRCEIEAPGTVPRKPGTLPHTACTVHQALITDHDPAIPYNLILVHEPQIVNSRAEIFPVKLDQRTRKARNMSHFLT